MPIIRAGSNNCRCSATELLTEVREESNPRTLLNKQVYIRNYVCPCECTRVTGTKVVTSNCSALTGERGSTYVTVY